MYHKPMTIKRRLFFSNIRIVLISCGAFVIVARAIAFFVYGTWTPDLETVAAVRDVYGKDMGVAKGALFFALFIILVSITNNFLTHRMTKRIIKPLGPLTEGVRQIYASNFAYRIDYQDNDEFRPVCEAFNEMAAKLETSTLRREKDEKARRELIAGISHDLRTPLTSIKGYIEGLETGVASTKEMQGRYLAVIKNKTADMEHIIEQLFLFSKLDMEEFHLDMRRTDISLALSDMVDDTFCEYNARGLVVTLAEMPKTAIVSADVLWLRSVLINILENSVKYKTKEEGHIAISAAVEDDSVLLRFADDGPGVQEETLAKLFDVFYRGDPSRNKKGSGLGLAINARIIERMGGSISAQLPATGGLAIVISLPLLQGEPL